MRSTLGAMCEEVRVLPLPLLCSGGGLWWLHALVAGSGDQAGSALRGRRGEHACRGLIQKPLACLVSPLRNS